MLAPDFGRVLLFVAFFGRTRQNVIGEETMGNDYERIENIGLIRSNLRHLVFELESDQPSAFRIAREAHQILLRGMVESLRGSANLDITGRPEDRRRRHWYKMGDEPWKAIQKTSVSECKEAWRYSTPVDCEAPELRNGESDKKKKRTDDYLVGFFDLLAMIQSEAFMSRYTESGPVEISDEQLIQIDWLHRGVRNEFEHFVPKLYFTDKDSCLFAAETCLSIASELLFNTNTVFGLDLNGIKSQIEDCRIAVGGQIRQARKV